MTERIPKVLETIDHEICRQTGGCQVKIDFIPGGQQPVNGRVICHPGQIHRLSGQPSYHRDPQDGLIRLRLPLQTALDVQSVFQYAEGEVLAHEKEEALLLCRRRIDAAIHLYSEG